jgi:hypothetical protein
MWWLSRRNNALHFSHVTIVFTNVRLMSCVRFFATVSMQLRSRSRSLVPVQLYGHNLICSATSPIIPKGIWPRIPLFKGEKPWQLWSLQSVWPGKYIHNMIHPSSLIFIHPFYFGVDYRCKIYDNTTWTIYYFICVERMKRVKHENEQKNIWFTKILRHYD